MKFGAKRFCVICLSIIPVFNFSVVSVYAMFGYIDLMLMLMFSFRFLM